MPAPHDLTEHEAGELLERIPRLRAEIAKAVVGQQRVVEELLTALLAGGHCLLEGLPGLGKTLLIRSLAQAITTTLLAFTPSIRGRRDAGTIRAT